MIQAAAAKKDTQRLQRAIVDGLEDIKAQDIQVFNTEHLSPLFERVIVASGTSNRQTKALAASVRDAVRQAGFPKPRVEGEENGEWIIVDCGAAVAHIMQPAIRNYYHLEEIWGEKPIRLKFGAPRPPENPATPRPTPAKKKDTGTTSLRRSSAAKSASRAAEAAQKAVKAPTARKGSAKTPAKAALKSPGAKAPVKKAPAAKKAVSRTGASAKKSPVKKAAAKKAPSRK